MENVTKKLLSSFLSGIILTILVLSMTTCGQQGPRGEQGIPGVDGDNGLTPTIGENGNWWIGDIDTGVTAEAKNGQNGADGVNGKDGVDGKNGIDGKDGANGRDGADGKDGITPKLLYNNGMIYVSYDNEASWSLLIDVDQLIEDGKDGQDGKDGTSITLCEINEQGELIIHYSTGDNINVGKVVGADGVDGTNGINGIDGKNGNDGVSVTSCLINDSGELVISYSDGSSENLGKVVGADGVNGTNGTNGTNGKNGNDGVSVTSCKINDSGELVISYSNGSSENLGRVVGTNGVNGTNGINGEDGKNGENGVTPQLKINTATRQWEVSYDNGVTWKGLGVVATGADGINGTNGVNGQNGVTPQLKIDTATNQWHVSYDNGESWTSLGVVATGPAGNDGMATIAKIGDDGYWYTSRNNGSSWENTGVKAEGSDGKDGDNGNDGRGIEKMEIIDGCLWVTYTDSTAPVNIGRVSSTTSGGGSGSEVVTEPYTDGLAFYPLGDGSEYGVSIGNALYMETIVIPSTYNGKPVTTILPRAFAREDGDNTTLISVVIPSSIVKIGNDAFSYCVALTNLTVPSSVIEIGDYAFVGVASVTFEISESEVPEGQEWNEGTLGCDEISWKK